VGSRNGENRLWSKHEDIKAFLRDIFLTSEDCSEAVISTSVDLPGIATGLAGSSETIVSVS